MVLNVVCLLRARIAKTRESCPGTGTEAEVPRAEFSKTGAKVNSNNGQGKKTGAKRGKAAGSQNMKRLNSLNKDGRCDYPEVSPDQ